MQKMRSSPTLQAPPITGKGGPELDAESAGAAPSSTNQDEVRRAFRRNWCTQTGSVAVYLQNCKRHHGGLRAGSKGAPEIKRRCRARHYQAEEEKEGQRQGETPGSDGNEQKERGGEAARPGQANPGPGGLRKDAGEAANGKDPEESIQNPQAESRGLQQTPGHPHGALRHSQSQLDEVASPSRVRSGIKEKWKAKLGLCLVPLVFSRNILLHIPLHLLLRQVLSKAVCPLSGTGLK